MKQVRILLIAAVGGFAMGGCSNFGSAPSGPTTPEAIVQAASEQPPQVQIRTIEDSPAPPEKKEALIKAIEDKYHVKRESSSSASPPGVNADSK